AVLGQDAVGQERVTARQERGVLVAPDHFERLIDGCWLQVIEAGRCHDVPPEGLVSVVAWRTAARTCSGCSGISRCVTPSGASASSPALTIAGGVAMAPDSPIPLMPSGVCGDGVTVCAVSR